MSESKSLSASMVLIGCGFDKVEVDLTAIWTLWVPFTVKAQRFPPLIGHLLRFARYDMLAMWRSASSARLTKTLPLFFDSLYRHLIDLSYLKTHCVFCLVNTCVININFYGRVFSAAMNLLVHLE